MLDHGTTAVYIGHRDIIRSVCYSEMNILYKEKTMEGSDLLIRMVTKVCETRNLIVLICEHRG